MFKYLTKDSLERIIQNIPEVKNPDIKFEQYPTPAWLAAEILLQAYLRGDLYGTVADLGCGTGRLCIGASLFRPERVVCIDVSCESIDVLREYAVKLNVYDVIDLICWDLSKDLENLHVDTVIMNPPFGVHKRGYDMMFLRVATEIVRRSVYSIHKYNQRSIELIKRLGEEKGFETMVIGLYDMEIRALYNFHRKKIHRFKVAVIHMRKR